MLDMGGMPAAASEKKAVRRVNASKNSKVRAVSFDFDLLTRCLQQDRQSKYFKEKMTEERSNQSVIETEMPNIDVIEQVASFLRVPFGGETTPNSEKYLSAIAVENQRDIPGVESDSLPNEFGDVRSKYASRLRQKLEGGVSAFELAQIQREESLTHGDAPVHLAARALAKENLSANSTGTRWMALTGTGALLNYLSNRSIKIALLPKPNHPNPKLEGKQMNDFSTQLQEVHVDVMLNEGTNSASVAVREALNLLGVDPVATLLVSDRDDYIRAATEAGMVSCRIRPMNSPRGNASAHFSKEEVAGVQEVIDEMNGISFNALLNR